jgi:hypothetical protein
MEEDRTITKYTTDWQGIALAVIYEANWLGLNGRFPEFARAHLEVRAVRPDGAKLPITETGYRSHFVPPGDVVEAGGPVAYVLTWLDTAAQSVDWRRHVVTGQQLSLF